MMKPILSTILFIGFTISTTIAIRCNFVFHEVDTSSIVFPSNVHSPESRTPVIRGNETFACSSYEDDDYVAIDDDMQVEENVIVEEQYSIKQMGPLERSGGTGFIFRPRVSPKVVANRFNPSGYEIEDNVCEESVKTITPKELNNIYNQLKKLDRATVQKIEITECINKYSDCSNGAPAKENKKTLCNQKFTKVQLKAVDDYGKVYDEIFYYPSSCICQTFKKKTGF